MPALMEKYHDLFTLANRSGSGTQRGCGHEASYSVNFCELLIISLPKSAVARRLGVIS
jgi:hypothetical protein